MMMEKATESFQGHPVAGAAAHRHFTRRTYSFPMNSPIATVPADFIPLTVVLPGDEQTDFLGYPGTARFVGFYWDNEVGGAVWTDGSETAPGHSQSFTFLRFVRPLAFLHNINFGTRGGISSHFLIWDREQVTGYFAPRQSAQNFLRGQRLLFTPIEAAHALHLPVL
jgi:hypothetical protein